MGILVLMFLGWRASDQGRPLMFAGLFAGYTAVMGLVFETPAAAIAVSMAVAFVFAAVYFWLLARFSDSLAIWLGVLNVMPLLWFFIQFPA